MTGTIMDLEKRFAEQNEEFSRFFRSLEDMSLESRAEAWKKLKKRQISVKENTSWVDVCLSQLEDMPDIAEYRVGRDIVAVSLLRYLREIGDIPYMELKIPRDISSVTDKYLSLFRKAQLIQLIRGDSSFDDPYGILTPGDIIIKLTDKGRALQYKGE